ncbi:SGNH/GDSL hydrolase family protein [Maribacter arenosus]|uniref:SGNH/GDSL hydrolase family protein n=1 Tax=Maribacter arenosus TaxID=1854708 RepID=A0ABR7VF18_9FLAO|nr:SGNH/GDSL hydrolase family protein [Maribacter arenosus]MBD0852202.1 SGNH/GDSL hydrolase family protein [Maribacter arenosus]
MLPSFRFSILLFYFLVVSNTYGQKEGLKWYSSDDFQVMGKSQNPEKLPFQRFPKAMESVVRERVWELSKNSSGLYVDFVTNSSIIEVQYQVEGEMAFPHMPATGVSGVDMYVLDDKAEWHWVRGNYDFRDSILYSFSGLKANVSKKTRMFRLYFPLYNTVKWLRIGIDKSGNFRQINTMTTKKPIIVYGTSIVQGACASRSGMAWPSILGRAAQIPVINLGFSGNGRLESEIIDYIAQTEASLYILDCMANFTSGQGLDPKSARKRLKKAVLDIRKRQPKTPILIVEHAGYSDGEIQPGRLRIYTDLNRATKEVYQELLKEQIPEIYLLKKEEIGLGLDSFVDGTHPNDYGMMQYAKACLATIRDIQN